MSFNAKDDYTSSLESYYAELLNRLIADRFHDIIDVVEGLEYLHRIGNSQDSRFAVCTNNHNGYSYNARLLKTRSDKTGSKQRKYLESTIQNRSKLLTLSSASPKKVSGLTSKVYSKTPENEYYGFTLRQANADTVQKHAEPPVTRCSSSVPHRTVPNCQTFSNKDTKRWLASKNAHILEVKRKNRDELTRRLDAEKEDERHQQLRANKASAAFERWLKQKNTQKVKPKCSHDTRELTKDNDAMTEAEEVEVHLSEHVVGRLNSTDAPILPGRSVTPSNTACPMDVLSVESTLSHETLKENSAIQAHSSLPFTHTVDQTLTNSACLQNPMVQFSPDKGLQKSPLSGNKQSTSYIDAQPAVKMTHKDWLVMKDEQAQRHQQMYRKAQQQIALLKRLDPKFLDAWTNLLKVRLMELDHHDPLTAELFTVPRTFAEILPTHKGSQVTRMVACRLDENGSPSNGTELRRRRLHLNVPPSGEVKQKMIKKLRKPGFSPKPTDNQETELSGCIDAGSEGRSLPEITLD